MSKSIYQMARKEVRNFKPYQAGKPIDELKRQRHLWSVIKLASNENAFGPSPLALKSAQKILKQINRYPDPGGYYLCKRIARHWRIPKSQVTLGNGTDELIELVAKAFLHPEDEIIISQHAFIRYRMAGELMGCKIKEIPMRSLTHDLGAFAEAITKHTKLCFIANPNNPTGTYVGAHDVSRFMNSIPTDVIVVFDEAYTEYVTAKDYPKTIEYLRHGKRIVILRTLSKIYGLAGLRIGYALAPSSIIELVDRIRPPFNTSVVAQAAACAALDDYAHIKKCSKLNRQEMKYLEGEFHKLGLQTIPSQCNFILVKFGKRADKINEKLLSRGIIVRPLPDYGLDEYLRITIGKPEENRKLVRALRGIL